MQSSELGRPLAYWGLLCRLGWGVPSECLEDDWMLAQLMERRLRGQARGPTQAVPYRPVPYRRGQTGRTGALEGPGLDYLGSVGWVGTGGHTGVPVSTWSGPRYCHGSRKRTWG